MTKKKPRPVDRPSVSPATVWLATIASTLVVILLCVGLFWLDNQAPAVTTYEDSSAQPQMDRNELIIIGVIFSAFILGPGILVALIVLPIIRKNKQK